MSQRCHTKRYRNDRKVECACCGQHLIAKKIDKHWTVYENGGRGYPKHNANTLGVRFYELNNNGKAIKSRSIMSKFLETIFIKFPWI